MGGSEAKRKCLREVCIEDDSDRINFARHHCHGFLNESFRVRGVAVDQTVGVIVPLIDTQEGAAELDRESAVAAGKDPAKPGISGESSLPRTRHHQRFGFWIRSERNGLWVAERSTWSRCLLEIFERRESIGIEVSTEFFHVLREYSRAPIVA